MYPLGGESLGLEPSGDGVAEDVRVEMDEAGREGFVLVGQEHWPFLAWADVVHQV